MGKESSCKTVIIGDDHEVVRAGLRLLVESIPQFKVVAEAGDFQEIANQVRLHKPDVVSIDISMPRGNVFDFLRQLPQLSPKTRAVVLTMYDDESYFRQAIAAGAAGYVLKNSADSDFLQALHSAANGKFFASVEFSRAQANAELAKQVHRGKLDSLSTRELAVLKSISLGMTNQAIADQLFLSVKTIESYRSRLQRKLDLNSRAEIVQFAIQAGILDRNTLPDSTPGQS